MVTSYFEDLFTSCRIGDPSKVLEGVGVCINDDMNSALDTPYLWMNSLLL